MDDRSDRDENVKRIPYGLNVHGLISRLNEIVEEIDEIYVVVKNKDGFVEQNMIGDMRGLAFAIMVLQKHALDTMEMQQNGQI